MSKIGKYSMHGFIGQVLALPLLLVTVFPAGAAQLNLRDMIIVTSEPVVIESDITEEGRVLKRKLFGLCASKRWDELDGLSKQYLESRKEFANGACHSDLFFRSFCENLENSEWIDAQGEFDRRFQWVESWMTAKPKSAAARTALAELYFHYAWFARGRGYADTVSKKDFALMAERERKSAKLADEAIKLGGCPRDWYILASIAKDESEESKLNSALKECLAHYPAYKTIYFPKNVDLQPRWGGEDGEWSAWLNSTSDGVGGLAGDKLYAQLVWAMDDTAWYADGNLIKDFHLNYPRIRRGMTGLMASFPASVDLLSAYCHLACLADDKSTAIALFKQLAGRVNVGTWRSCKKYFEWRNKMLL